MDESLQALWNAMGRYRERFGKPVSMEAHRVYSREKLTELLEASLAQDAPVKELANLPMSDVLGDIPVQEINRVLGRDET